MMYGRKLKVNALLKVGVREGWPLLITDIVLVALYSFLSKLEVRANNTQEKNLAFLFPLTAEVKSI